MGTSQSRQNTITAKLYKWSTQEFGEEYALIYTSTGRFEGPRSCTFYYRVKGDKVVVTMHDALVAGNQVRVNMEFVAVKDEKGRFKFGPVKFKHSGYAFLEQSRSRRSIERKLLFLRYSSNIDSGRENRLGLYRYRKGKEYKVIFHSGVASDDYFMHRIEINSDHSKGINVNLAGPYRCSSIDQKELCDTEIISSTPPDHVIDKVDDILKDLKIEDENRVGDPQNIYNSKVINNGINQGQGNGCINIEKT